MKVFDYKLRMTQDASVAIREISKVLSPFVNDLMNAGYQPPDVEYIVGRATTQLVNSKMMSMAMEQKTE